MENIKIESSWNSATIHKECSCETGTLIDVNYVVDCEPDVVDVDEVLDFMNSANRLFTNNLNAIKYPNLIITQVTGKSSFEKDINIFDVIKNKIVFSSAKIMTGEYSGFSYESTLMMETFMIMKYRSFILKNNYNGYIIYNFETQKYSLFMYYDLLINNDRSMFVFYKRNEKLLYTEIKIITKYDINKVITFSSIDSIECICNPNILLFKSYLKDDTSKCRTNYYDIKKQKTVYVSENQFIGWRGNRFIEYDTKGNCNLISFINEIVIPVAIKEYKNCKRCLDKFMSEDEICDECKTN
jgi:hypothetical protein